MTFDTVYQYFPDLPPWLAPEEDVWKVVRPPTRPPEEERLSVCLGIGVFVRVLLTK